MQEQVPLDFNLIYSSSEDPKYPLYELQKTNSIYGWQSKRYCQYPQTIIIQFKQPVNLKKIEEKNNK